MTMAQYRWFLSWMFLGPLAGVTGQCVSTFTSRPLVLQASKYIADSIYSPGYPDKYDDNEECSWSISTGDPFYVVKLTVIFIDLETSSDGACGYDYIKVYDGSSRYPFHRNSINRFCTNEVRELYSSGEGMYIEFVSDSSITQQGFHLTYEAVPYTSVPITTTIQSTTTTTDYSQAWRTHINTGALIGGLVGGLMVLFIFCALCRYYMRSNQSSRMARAAYHTTSNTSTTSQAQFNTPHTIYQNNNAVFMVTPPISGSTQTVYHHPAAFGGITNLAYSSAGDAPPSYFSVQHPAGLNMQAGGMSPPNPPPSAAPPPSYTEAMRMSHPPAVPVTATSVAAPVSPMSPVSPVQPPTTEPNTE